MSDSFAQWARWRIQNNPAKTASDLDELRVQAVHAKEMVATKGWAFLREWLAGVQTRQINVLSAKPTEQTADGYALRHAYESGFLAGIRHAYDTPQALIAIAEQELAWAQKAGEKLARAQEGND